MHRFSLVVRMVFAAVFIAGGISHFILGRSIPEGYAAFGDTAAMEPLADLWTSFVMPNIGWLTIVTGAVEILVGIGLLLGGTLTRASVILILVFFAFLLLLGYGFPTSSFSEDFLKNRLGNLILAAPLVPILMQSSAAPVWSKRE